MNWWQAILCGVGVLAVGTLILYFTWAIYGWITKGDK